MTDRMLTVVLVVLVVLAVASVWVLVAVLFAFLAGGVIHARDHRDAPYGGFSRPVQTRSVVRLVPARSPH